MRLTSIKTMAWFSILALSVSACFAGQIKLSDNGEALADIVIANEADRAAKWAAADLAWHLKEITGADFAVVTDDTEPSGKYELRVGQSNRTKLKSADFAEQEFLVDIRDDAADMLGCDKDDKAGSVVYTNTAEKLIIKGSPDIWDLQGTCYAVYEFLERQCGVVWADSTDWGTVIKKNPSLTVETSSRRAKPFISYRGGTFGNNYCNPTTWKASKTSSDYVGYTNYTAFAYGTRKNETGNKHLFMLRHRAGGDYAPANHSFYYFYDLFWNKKSKSFKEYRPEFFAKGYEVESDPTLQPPQLCYSNPETIKQVVTDIRAYFDNPKGNKKWGRNNYCLEPMDNSDFCKCPNCSKYYEPERSKERSSYSTYWFTFVNTVAKEIRKTHPDKRLTTLAYGTHEGMPTGIILEDNVTVYFCISGNRSPFGKGGDKQIERMLEWRKAYPKQPIAMWLYNCFPMEHAQNGGFHCVPGFFSKVEEEQYRIFNENNISAGIFHCGFNGETDNFIQLEYMFGPFRPVSEMLDEFFSQYGKAGKPLRAFYELVESRFCDRTLRPSTIGAQSFVANWKYVCPTEIWDKLTEYMDEAEKLAETPVEKARVQLWKLTIYNYMKEGHDSFVRRDAAQKPSWTAKRVPNVKGNPRDIDWSVLPHAEQTLWFAGGENQSHLKGDIRFCYDDTHVYAEITVFVKPEDVTISPLLNPFDTWETCVGRQEGVPCRYYISSADGRIKALSHGEVNFRMHVWASESGDASFGARCFSNLKEHEDRWVSYIAFPRDSMCDKPVGPGDTVWFNTVLVGSSKLFPGSGRFSIYTFVNYTTVHTTDRLAPLILEK